MQISHWGLKFGSWFLLVCLFGASSAHSLTEPGFRDRLGVYPPKLVNDADATIMELSKKYGVPIAFESGGDVKTADDAGAIMVRLSLEDGFKAQVAIGEAVVSRGLLSYDDGKRLSHVMNAYIKEALADTAIFAGIQFLQSSFDSKVKGESTSFEWERLVLTLLVVGFLVLSVAIFFFDREGANSSASARHLF